MSTFCIKEEIVYGLILFALIYFIRNNNSGKKQNSRPIIINKINTRSKKKSVGDVFLKRDQAVLSNPLVAPFRRMARHVYGKNQIRLNFPTRGYADNFQYIGNLIRKSDEKLVKLFGRQTYPGSTQYEYYGMMSDNGGSQIKVQISNSKELYNGDIVNIPLLNNSSFIVQMHKLDQPRYNPNV
jgi:hypothetical protein